MAYELWNTQSRNIVGDYGTEQLAMAMVREATEIGGQDAAESLAPAYEDANGRTTVVAVGAELAARARSPLEEAVGAGRRHPRNDTAGSTP